MHEPPPSCPCCGGTVLRKIGEDVTEVLEYTPSAFQVIEHVRPKVSCRGCETIVQAPVPSLPIERGRPGPGLLAYVIVSKFADALPLHRQSVIYERQGVELNRTILADWVGTMAALTAPLVEQIRRHVVAGPVLHADDTPVPVLAPGQGQTKTGRLWVALRDEGPWSGSAPPGAFYYYSPDRRGERAIALVGECHGFLHADGYGGFNGLYQPNPKTGEAPLIEVACWSLSGVQRYPRWIHVQMPFSSSQPWRGEKHAVHGMPAGDALIRTPSPIAELHQKQSQRCYSKMADPRCNGRQHLIDDARDIHGKATDS